jgi:hypothetical protein
MAPSRSVPQDVREQVIRIVEQFNAERRASASRALPPQLLHLLRRAARTEHEAKPAAGDYVPRFKGRYLYLDRAGFGGRLSEICRLTWTGDMTGWEFAIYRHSKNRYDPDEWFFPGAEEVDGTLEGAMRAGLAAYPE